MPTELKDRKLIEIAKSHQPMAVELAFRSDCSEAKYGAVIFRGTNILGSGYNHMPNDFHGKHSCESCPRYNVGRLKGGVGSELCVTVHAEQAAIADMLRARPGETGRGATMLIEKVKRGEVVVRTEYPKPRCVECAKYIVNMTDMDQIIFPVRLANGFDTFTAFSQTEFHQLSVENLVANWKKTFPELRLNTK